MIEKLSNQEEFSRRKYLAALSASTAAGAAGCLGDDGDDEDPTPDDELGEIVEEVTIEAFSGLPTSGQIEEGSSHLVDVLEDLGVPASINVKEVLTLQDELYGDARNWNFHIDYHPPFPFFLDPHRLMIGRTLPYSGSNDLLNLSQYASCEYTELVHEQQRTADADERRNLIHQAEGIFSDDIALINLLAQTNMGVYRNDQVEIPDIGEAGLMNMNYDALLWSSIPVDDHDIITYISPSNIDSVVYQTTIGLDHWSHGVYSSLVGFDKDLDLVPELAHDWDVEDEGTTYRFYLREDATFHNGEPITAEDAAWTFEFIEDNFGEFALAEQWSYESIEAVDEHTLEIQFPDPAAHFLRTHVAMWGILPSDIWIGAGADEGTDVDIEPDEIVGSGPYQITGFQPEEILDLEPYDDHWMDVEGNVVFRGFHDLESARRALVEGEINVIPGADVATVEIVEEELGDIAVADHQPAFVPWWLVPQVHFGPTKFVEFRHAVSEGLDRALLNELMEHGESEPHLYSTNLGETAPFYPDDPDAVLNRIAESPMGDLDRAREILEDHGWGWDEDGRLHYPPDADLDPLWPEGSEPCAEEDLFDCVPDVC